MVKNLTNKESGKYFCTVFEIVKGNVVKLTFPLVVESKTISI